MRAKEYYEEIKEFVKHPHFTKLTSTGIDPDYQSIFEFAEAYHDAANKANGVETSNDKCTLHGVSASFLAHLEMQLNYHKKNEQNKREMGDYEKAMYHRDRGGAIEDLIIHIKNAR